MLLDFTKRIFEKKDYLVLSGDNSCDFISVKGVRDPMKYVLWKEKAFVGFNIVVEEEKEIKISTLKARGFLKKLNDLYYDYNLYNAGILIFFRKYGQVKYLTWDRAKAFIDHGINDIDMDYLLDLDFYTTDLGTTHSYLNAIRGDITMNSAQANATLESDQRRLKMSKEVNFWGKNNE